MRKLTAFIIFISAVLLAYPVSASGANVLKLSHKVLTNDGTSIVATGGGNVVLNGTLLNTRTQQTLNLSIGADEPILDVKTISHPDKIIVLTRSKERKILKYSFSTDGRLLQKSFINIPLGEQGRAQWTPSAANTPEQVWVQRDKLFSVYKAPWRKAEASFDSTYKDTAYEYSNVIDWRASSSPYLVLEYDGAVIMGSQRYLTIVNMKDKSQRTLEIDQNPFLNLQITGSKLEVTTNWWYQDPFPANVEHPDSGKEQPLLSLIDLQTAASTVMLKGIFEEKSDAVSGWESELFGSQMYVKNLLTNTWSLYDLTGRSVLSNQPAPAVAANSTVHFIGCDAAVQKAYFATFSSSKTQVSITSVPVE